MKNFSIILTIVFVGCFACKNASEAFFLKDTIAYNLVLGDTSVIKVRETLINEEKGISILMDSVLSESRCPLGVECIWEGNAAVRFVFKSDNLETKFILNTALIPKDTTINGYKISLLNLLPYPIYSHPASYSEYHANIIVQKN